MEKLSRIGMDTSKQIFVLHGVDGSERLDCFVAALLAMTVRPLPLSS